MVKIHRIWFNTERMDREDHYKITLFSRPRVSIHVDEYIHRRKHCEATQAYA